MIIYKGQQMTVREACKLMGIDCDDFMAWVQKICIAELRVCFKLLQAHFETW